MNKLEKLYEEIKKLEEHYETCSACKGPHFQKSKYCPNCGARMEDKP